MKYDLEARTKSFSKVILQTASRVSMNEMNKNILSQLLRSATSIGANYCEANNASSKKDFTNKIYICRKEAQETKYWIELLSEVETNLRMTLRPLWKEAQELSLILNKITFSLRENNKK